MMYIKFFSPMGFLNVSDASQNFPIGDFLVIVEGSIPKNFSIVRGESIGQETG